MGWLSRLCGIEHTAELRGRRVTFTSSARSRSWMLLSDAIQACKDAGIYEHWSDGDRVLVDGQAGYDFWE